MSDDEINVAIAEHCGWGFHPECGPLDFPWWHRPTRRRASYETLPNYCGDLNAMHEAEETLNRIQWSDYFDTLAEINEADTQEFRNAAYATARQRAEAFLRTLGKWRE